MKIISLFFPCLISIILRHNRVIGYSWKMPMILFEYGISVLTNVWITMLIVTDVFHKQDVTIEALDRFSFFTKYTVIAIIVAVFTPYVEEILKKYIEIKFTVRRKDEEETKSMENNQ